MDDGLDAPRAGRCAPEVVKGDEVTLARDVDGEIIGCTECPDSRRAVIIAPEGAWAVFGDGGCSAEAA